MSNAIAKTSRGILFLFLSLLVALPAAPVAEPVAPPKALAKPVAPDKALAKPVAPGGPDLIVVGEDEPWMAALAAPVAGLGRQGDRLPLVIAVSWPPSCRANWLIGRASPHKVVVLAAAEAALGLALSPLAPEVLTLSIDPVSASLAVARRFWPRTRQVVAAAADDMEAIVRGSSLAAEMGLPLLIRPRSDRKTALLRDLCELGAEEVLAVVSDPERKPRWARTEMNAVNSVLRCGCKFFPRAMLKTA